MENNVEVVSCDKEKILDESWLFNNVHWGNFSGKDTKLMFNEVTTLYYSVNIGTNSDDLEIRSGEFDNIMVYCSHGFAGNEYIFIFRLGDTKSVHATYDYYSFSFSKDDLKKRMISKCEKEMRGLKNQINDKEKIVKKINKL